MQTMNTDQQSFFPNPASATYYPAGSLDQQYAIRNPGVYPGTRMPAPFYNQAVTNGYAQAPLYFQQSPYLSPAPFVHNSGPRGQYNVQIVRPPNENPAAGHNYISAANYSPYGNSSLIPGQPLYAPTYPQYSMPAYGPQTSGAQISNPPQSSMQYTTPNNQQLPQAPPTSQQAALEQQHGSASQAIPPRENVKREKKPLAIVDPKSNKALEIEKLTSATNLLANDESITDSKKSKDDIIESQRKREAFRKDFAESLNVEPQAEKVVPTPVASEEKPTENVNPSSTPSSRSNSISKVSSEPVPLAQPGIRTGSVTEPPATEEDLKPTETVSPPNELESVEGTASNESESETGSTSQTSSRPKRYGYTIEELRQKSRSLLSQERPNELREIQGVTTPKLHVKPKIDGAEQFIRDVTSILNKLTPQKYDVLLQQLDELELNSAERLEGLISVIFIKAVEAAIFCSLYAKLCKHFQKRQVTVPNANGQSSTFFFRQILLTRCQKQFENDYRQEIDYDTRKGQVDAIADEKARREAVEDLEEALVKAKRKNLGNIIFIGELFKLQMLTDTIMYDCIDYLLKDKADEESLECLCRLLRTIGKELDSKAGEKTANRKNLEKNYAELFNITTNRQASARMRFMIQDILEMRKNDWTARRAEIKPTTIDEIHESERIRREREEREQDRERQQRREQHRGGGGPQQYTESRGSRGSGMKQQSNRADDDRVDNRLIVDSLRQYQSNDKKNPGQLPLNLAPQRAWSKGSGVEKKAEDDRSNAAKMGKPPASANQQFRPKTGPSNAPNYGSQRQSSRELARESSHRDRDNALESLRKTAGSNLSRTNSREGSRNPSRDSSVAERTSPLASAKQSNANTSSSSSSFDEEKVQTRVHALIEEYTENYSDSNDRSVHEAIEDLTSFCTANTNQQAVVVRELFTNVLEAKPRARKAVGHLLDVALEKNVFSTDGSLAGMKLFMDVVPDFEVDIPLLWQYIGQILGAWIGAPSSNMSLLKSIFPLIPKEKCQQLFQDILRYAVEFSSQSHAQTLWQSSHLTLNDFGLADSPLATEYSWLNQPSTPREPSSSSPAIDPQLVKLFKSINDQNTTVTDEQILEYIHQNMNVTERYYVRNIVLSYLEACLINREPQKKLQEDIAKQRMTVLKSVIQKTVPDEVQAVYAIQNFVHKLEHPPKMAQLLFDIFYDEDCVSEDAFRSWLNKPDPSETEGHSVVVISTKDFFDWLNQPDGEEEA